MSYAAALVVAVMALAAGRAAACTCIDDERSVTERLRAAKAKAAAVFTARVVTVESGEATFEVHEVFKGSIDPRITLPSGSGIDCRYPFAPGHEMLVYASRSDAGGLAVSFCSRTRLIRDRGDDELSWLRTGAEIPTPVAMERELVDCTRCDVTALAARFAGVGEGERRHADGGSPPFWVRERRASSWPTGAVLGVDKEGRPFRLDVAPPDGGTAEQCRQVVTRSWCEQLAPGPPLARCVGAHDVVTLCDENATRTSQRPGLESMRAVRTCNWSKVDPLTCELEARVVPLDGGASTPRLACSPAWGNTHLCRVVRDDR